MVDHGAREHALWSASATARNWHCAGALTLAPFGEDKPSIHADTGTAGHQIAERCLREGREPIEFLGTIEKTKAHNITVDEELVRSVEEYVDYCRGLIGPCTEYWLEERFVLDKLDPPFEAGGTGDFVAYFEAEKRLEIVDFKNGRGVVDAEGNPQLRTYALGAMLAHPGLDIDHVTVTIVQPRAAHKDGRIRSETIHVIDLAEWSADLVAAMKRSKQAMDEYDAAGGNAVLLDEWSDKWLRPGKCTFCPVEGSCPALRKQALDVAALWFDDMSEPRIGNSALETDPESVARDLDMIPMLEDWIKARRALAHTMAEQGQKLPCADGEEYYLADKIGNRKWTDEAALAAAMGKAGLSDDDIYAEPKLKSPAALEKVLGAKRKALIEPFVERPVTGTNLVRSDKTSRPPAKSVAAKYFET